MRSPCFTNGGTPWLAVNPNYTTINAAAELADPNSIFHFTRRAIALHHAHAAFVYGDYTDLDPEHPQIYAYTRSLGDESFLVVLNLSREPITYRLPQAMKAGTLGLANLPQTTEHDTGELHLAGWEARVYRLH